MYHVQLRQFPHNFCAFNLTEAELFETLVGPWSREEWVELGERKWNSNQARLKVLEGPHLAIEELSMGRGWRDAQHQGEDVTERVIARAKAPSRAAEPATVGQATAPRPDRVAPAAEPRPEGVAPAVVSALAPANSPAVASPDAQLAPLLGSESSELLQAWRLAAGRRPELSPSESLALAEATLRSLGGNPR
jgi:hypothetical protein